jgi:thymidylate synthase (FAD)
MRSELPNTYTYLEDGNVLVRARNRQNDIIENQVDREQLTLEVDYKNRQGEKDRGIVNLKPVTSSVTRLDTILDQKRYIYLGALNCYTGSSTEDLIETAKEKPDHLIDNFLEKQILSTGHGSVMEHVSPCFIVDGISRVESHQEVRHRHRGYSQQSQRYLDFARPDFFEQGEAEFSFIIPPRIRVDQKKLDMYLHTISESIRGYYGLRADGVFPEDSRFLFPNAAATRIVISANPRAWREVITQRTCARAQWEIDITTTEIAKQIWENERVFVEEVGPACSLGKCDQGKRSCHVPLEGSLAEVFDQLKPGDSYPHDELIFGMR